MAIRKDCTSVKNGNDTIIIYYSYDDEKPKCWIEGNQYRFNKQTIFTEIVRNTHAKSDRNR